MSEQQRIDREYNTLLDMGVDENALFVIVKLCGCTEDVLTEVLREYFGFNSFNEVYEENEYGEYANSYR